MELFELNFHRLLCFWMIAEEGSVVAAAKRLRLRQPTLSAHLCALEQSLGIDLFHRVGRQLVLTDAGRLLKTQADAVFAAAQRLVDSLNGLRASGRTLAVGIVESFPRLIAWRVFRLAALLQRRVQLVCRTGKLNFLLGELLTGSLDVVLADGGSALDHSPWLRWHLLGRSTLGVFAPPPMAPNLRRRFPASLRERPFLLPTREHPLRRKIDSWLQSQHLPVRVVAECEDASLLKALAADGYGCFIMPTVERTELARIYNLRYVAAIPSLTQEYYAVVLGAKNPQPLVMSFIEDIRKTLSFRPESEP